ncbi:hypothetical protein CDL15_Pgr002406 [Punica granatum]|uniref:26S proteasome non-ATPase regulatory subunit 5 n=1 Tax=Punica granatum TaxID=22663 RepID=A0A218XVL3_PUNGR|nr:hypothetical protein CDL15_Pgr002406 [Punica granatum]
MEEEKVAYDSSQLLDAASDFAYYPGVQNDGAVKEFLDRFPLPVIINALQTKSDVPGLENVLVNCLERAFRTKYGASFIPHYMPFIEVGLKADSPAVKTLACKTVRCLLENNEGKTFSVKLIKECNIYPLLLDCLVNGDEQVSAASLDAIKVLASFQEGRDIVFPPNSDEATHLGNLAARCTSLGRVRVLALIVKLFSISSSMASVIFNMNLLSLLEAEMRNTDDTLIKLSILELFYELTEIQHGTEFLSATTLLQLLESITSNQSADSILRSRALAISGRLLSRENIYVYVDEPAARSVVTAIDGRLGSLETLDIDEHESALETLGQIGSSTQGATLLLSSPNPAARHIVQAAFDRQGRGKIQLAALHALGNLAGEVRSENSVILNSGAEEALRFLIYETASKSSKLTPSGLFLSVLQQESATRLAAYRMLTALVARPWCLMEIFSKQEILDTVTNPTTETSKIGMEARHNCCKAILEAFSSSNLVGDPTFAKVVTKLQEAVRRGPYLGRKHAEAQPVVMTAERF